jgi:hypothetical protein
MYKAILFFFFSLTPSVSCAVLVDDAGMDYRVDHDGAITYRLCVLRKIISNGLTPNVRQISTQPPVEKMPFGECQDKLKVLANRNDNLAMKWLDFKHVVAYKYYYESQFETIECRDDDTIGKSVFHYQAGVREIVR